MFTTRVIDEKEKDRYNAFVIHHPRDISCNCGNGVR